MKLCHYCGTGDAQTRDHIVPRSLGGVDAPWNLVRACYPCNSAKGAALPTCECERCASALARWRAGERVPVVRPRSRGGSHGALRRKRERQAAELAALPPELRPLSPAMRSLLLRRAKKGA